MKENKSIKLFIFGTGDYGNRMFEFLHSINVDVEAFIKTKAEEGDRFNNCPVYSIYGVKEHVGEGMVLISVYDSEIVNQIRIALLDQGIKTDKILDLSGFINNNLPTYSKRCLICGKAIDSFLPGEDIESPLFKKYHIIGGGHRNNKVCPHCYCIDRVRWVLYCLRTKTGLFDLKDKRVLHFAPEKEVRSQIEKADYISYFPADINPSYGVLRIDMTDIPFSNNSFDYIIANHVLEHVSDLGKAMRELGRVLKPDGALIISFPICMEIDTIEEKGSYDTKRRLEEFGQEDHVRLFGKDYKCIIEQHGFAVDVHSPKDVLNNSAQSLGLIEDDVLLVCRKA